MPLEPDTDQAGLAPDRLLLPYRRAWLGWLLAGGVLLALVSVVLQMAKHRGWQPASLQLDRLLNVDEDLSVLNWLTASTFLVAALAAFAMRVRQHACRLYWLAVAGVLAFVSLDEAAGVHDPVSTNAEAQLRSGGVSAVGVLVVVAILGVIVVWAVLRMAPPVRWRVTGAFALLFVAAVGIDALGADLTADPAARLETGYVAKATLEEILELGAAVLVLDGMLAAALKR